MDIRAFQYGNEVKESLKKLSAPEQVLQVSYDRCETYHYKTFDFDAEDLEEATAIIQDLAHEPSYSVDQPRSERHLQPILGRAERSTGTLGRLSEGDVRKLKANGGCTHNKILVLLLEPTKFSQSTEEATGCYLRRASGELLNADNTAILDCRALVPNASYNERYSDGSRTGEYNFRGVKAAIKALKPDVIVMCQSSVTKVPGTFIGGLTKSNHQAGDQTLLKMDKTFVHVVQAFHPSMVTKHATGRKAAIKDKLLQFCFVLAVNLAEGIDIVGPGLDKLRLLAQQNSSDSF